MKLGICCGKQAIEQFFTSCQLFPNFDNHDHEKRSGYEIMETEYGISMIGAEQSLEPVVATPYETVTIKPSTIKYPFHKFRKAFQQ